MSILIEIQDESPFVNPENVKQTLNAIFRTYFSDCHRIVDEGKSIKFYVRPSNNAYRLTTLWNFQFVGPSLKLHILFYNTAEKDFLRAYTDRMKLQLTILINKINPNLQQGLVFKVSPDSGHLELYFAMLWQNFHQIFDGREKLVQFICRCVELLWFYDELMIFLEPIYRASQKQIKYEVREKINKFRKILKNTKNVIQSIQGQMGSLLRIKSSKNMEFYREQMISIKEKYMRNIYDFQESLFDFNVDEGSGDEFTIDASKYEGELKKIRQIEEAIMPNQSKVKTKIVLGVRNIKPYKPDKKPKILSQEGAHSQIYRDWFKCSIVSSISIGTTEFIEEKMGPAEVLSKDKVMELTYKVCNETMQEPSINSFRNELDALKFLRFQSHPSIAEYFLNEQSYWNEKDVIYMKSYESNLLHLLKNHQLSNRKKLEMTYNIAKGLGFLYKHKICHRDFKPQNIVVTKQLKPKIIDFGSCVGHYQSGALKVHDRRLLTTEGFHIYYNRLPESHYNLRYKFRKDEYEQHPLFDVYSFGRVINFIFFGRFEKQEPEVNLEDPHAQFLDNISFLIHMCLQVDPDDRPSYGEITAFLGVLKQLLDVQFPDKEES